MDFPSAWKAMSIALTGAFGLMGLLTDNKNKETGKLTTWGKVSLSGIVLSTALGVVAQLKENSDEAQRREASAIQTLELLKQTSSAVSDIQRLLSPFDISTVSLVFEGNCQQPKFAHFCEQAKNLKDSGNWPAGQSVWTMDDPAVWKMWPEESPRLPVHLYFFRDPPDPTKLENVVLRDISDLVVDVFAARQKNLELSWDNGKIEFGIYSYVPYSMRSSGKIASLMDLQDASLVMTERNNSLALLAPTWINIKTKQSRELTIDTAKLEKISIGGNAAYLYKFGNPTHSAAADKSPRK